jgi:hypothetical protein
LSRKSEVQKNLQSANNCQYAFVKELIVNTLEAVWVCLVLRSTLIAPVEETKVRNNKSKNKAFNLLFQTSK